MKNRRSAVSPAQILLRQAVRLVLLKNMPCLSRACLRIINKPFSPYLSISSPECSPTACRATNNMTVSACRHSHFIHPLSLGTNLCTERLSWYNPDCKPEHIWSVWASKQHVVLPFATDAKYQREWRQMLLSAFKGIDHLLSVCRSFLVLLKRCLQSQAGLWESK